MSQISVTNLSFSYDGSRDPIFENVSFQLDTDWRIGFTGRNGRGKTTFLNLMLGKYEYAGTISASVGFDYFPFEVAEPSQTTSGAVRAAIGDFEEWELVRELSYLDVPAEALDRPFNTLSGGERSKVLLAALFLKQDNFLLIDEPTNHLDTAARRLVGSYLKSKHGFILVSHDRELLDHCVDHILSINKTDIEVQRGNFSSWHDNKQRRDDFERTENERLQKDIKKLETAAKRTATWSDNVEKSKYNTLNSGIKVDRGFIGHKSAKMMKRSKSIEARRNDALEQKSGLLKNIERADELSVTPLQYRSERLLELKDVSVSYGGRVVLEHAGFEIDRGDRIALLGKNGCGKSSLLKLITGEHTEYGGILRIGSGLTVSCVPQDASFLRGGLKEFAEESHIDESLFKAILRKLDFSREQFEKDMQDFSGGQKKKVLIAKSLCEKAHLYIWDEPLNFIDVLSRIQIEELILRGNPTMLFVEHDAAFVSNVATKTVTIAP